MKTQGINALLATFTMLGMLSTAQAQVYKTTDKDGNVVYTDQPPTPGAEPMQLRELSVVPVPEYAAKTKAVQSAGLEPGEKADLGELRRGYRDFALTSPAAEQTFTGTGNVATVAWETRFALQPGMSVIVHVDDQPLPPTTATVMTTPPLDRGTHTVRAELVDEQKRSIAKAGPVTFFVHQNTVLNNPNRPRG
jgi:hypothetical protein